MQTSSGAHVLKVYLWFIAGTELDHCMAHVIAQSHSAAAQASTSAPSLTLPPKSYKTEQNENQ